MLTRRSLVDAAQFNLLRDDGVQGEEVGVSPPSAEAELSEDHISESSSECVFEFAAEEKAEVEIPQHFYVRKHSWGWIS